MTKNHPVHWYNFQVYVAHFLTTRSSQHPPFITVCCHLYLTRTKGPLNLPQIHRHIIINCMSLWNPLEPSRTFLNILEPSNLYICQKSSSVPDNPVICQKFAQKGKFKKYIGQPDLVPKRNQGLALILPQLLKETRAQQPSCPVTLKE